MVKGTGSRIQDLGFRLLRRLVTALFLVTCHSSLLTGLLAQSVPWKAANVNNIRFADQFPGASATQKIDAAVADLGGAKGLVVIPSGMGAEGPTNIPETATLLDLRGGETIGPAITLNSQSTGVHSLFRAQQARGSPDRSETSLYGVTSVSGALPSGQSLIGTTGQVETWDVLTAAPSGLNLIGMEASAVLSSTGQTIPTVRGLTANISTTAGNTTNITNAQMITAESLSKAGSETITNVYGLVLENQNVGSSRNYALWSQGDTLQSNDRNWNVLDSAGVPRPFVSFDYGDFISFRPLSDATGFLFSNQAWTANWLTIKNGNVGVGWGSPSYKFSVGTDEGTTTLGSNKAVIVSRDSAEGQTWALGNNILGVAAKTDFGIANYTVSASPFLAITNAGVVSISRAIASGLNAVSFSGTPTFNAALGNTQKITLTGEVTSSTLAQAAAGEQINFLICQDTTGNHTFVWPTNVKGGMTIGSTASTCSAQSFIFDGTSAYALSSGVTNM